MPRTTSSSTFQELTNQLGTEELLKRLKSSCKILKEYEGMDDTNASSIHSFSSTLLQPFLQTHRSREVKSLVACCIADIFRICYPDPPYNDSQNKVVFNLFISQLQALEKPTSPSFKYSLQLLETLATIRLFNLCIEMDDQDILTDIFKTFFSVINDQLTSKVKNYIIDILSSLVQEGESLPQVVMDLVLSNILEPHKTENKAVYEFTIDFIRKTSAHIEPYIHLFFNNALVVGKSSESEMADHLYDLILELHAIDSSVLLAVMPQLEFKLRSTDKDERFEVTKLLAKMFSLKGSKLAGQNKPLWNCFLGRFSDVSPHIRIECVRRSKHFIINHPQLIEDVTLKLHERFYDKEERVRLEVVKAVCDVAAENFEVVRKELRDDLEGRMRDKVWSIRKESISSMARIYRQMMSSSFSSGGALNSVSFKTLHWIPTKILHCYYRDSADDKLCVERCLLSCIVPVNLPDTERMERMVHVYNSLSDNNAVRAFDALLASRHRMRGYLRDLIQAQQDSELEEEQKKKSIVAHVIQLVRQLPDSMKSQAYLDYLVRSLDDNGLKESLLKSIDTSCSCAEILKAKVEVLGKVGSRAGLLEMMRNLLDRSCPMLVDANCVRILVVKVCDELYEPSLGPSKEAEEEAFERAKKALQLIRVLAGIMPANFSCTEVFEKLITLLRLEDKDIVKSTLQILTLTGAHIDQSVAGCLQPILTQLAVKGEPRLTKDTVRCIHKVFREPKAIMQRLYSSLVSHLDYDGENFETVLISLGQIAKLQPEIFATKFKFIIRDFIIKKLMVVDRAENEYVKGENEWAEDDKISYEARMKVFGMKLLVNWLLGLSSPSEREKNSSAVLRLLDRTLDHDGDLQAQDNIAAHDRSRLRLAAASSLLKMIKSSVCRDFVTVPILLRLALVAQDTCKEVREKFLEKLNKGLMSLQLPLGYLSIMVYVGIEPEKACRDKFRKIISNNVTKRRQCMNQNTKAKENPHAILPEYAVSYAIYLVAHHPQFSRTNSHKLDMFKECLWFFLEPIVIRDNNYGFLWKLLETIKLTVDAQDPTNSEANKNLYAACDLAMGVMASKLLHIKLADFEGEVVLPSKLFKSKGTEKRQSNDIRYLPPEYNCTPTKRVKTDILISPNSTASVAEASPIKRAKSPAAKQANKKAPVKRASKGASKGARAAKPPSKQAPAKAESKGHTAAIPTTKTKAKRQAKPAVKKTAAMKRTSGRKKKIEEEEEEEESEEEEEREKDEEGKEEQEEKELKKVKDDSGVSDVEEDGEEDEVVESATILPAKGRKRTRVAAAPKKRTVKRKVLQKSDGEEENNSSPEEEAPPVRVTRRSKRNAKAASSDGVENDQVSPNETDEQPSEEQPDHDTPEPPAKKRSKLQKVATDHEQPEENKSSNIKRKTRHRR